MPNYVDGFVFPISLEFLEQYKPVASAVAEIYKEHGALDYLEFVGDDLSRDGTRSFTDAVGSTEGETVVFGWIVFESKESRDEVNKKVESDPRMVDLVAPLMNPSNPVFDPTRMAYGGFLPLVGVAG